MRENIFHCGGTFIQDKGGRQQYEGCCMDYRWELDRKSYCFMIYIFLVQVLCCIILCLNSVDSRFEKERVGLALIESYALLVIPFRSTG
jgi:hypothetical protein